jgi:RimJ/RimL family protein N-acetyltransferase
MPFWGSQIKGEQRNAEQMNGEQINAVQINATPAKRPVPLTLPGRYVTLVPLEPRVHGDSLFRQTTGVMNDELWRYLFDGPFTNRTDFHTHLLQKATSDAAVFFAILNNSSGSAVGYASFMRIEPEHRCMEVGNILYSPILQRTPAATEAMYLMARHAFDDLGYRRYEWKCNALNEPSRRAALRYGFQFEGIFRQHLIVKGANRDSAWYSMLDGEWPTRKANFERWLSPKNFDSAGKQMMSLSAMNGGN